MSRYVHIFATRKDLLDLLAEIESKRPINYTRAGLLESPPIEPYVAASKIPDLGICRAASTNLGLILLIADIGTEQVLPMDRWPVECEVIQTHW